jgi:hypothetical protein
MNNWIIVATLISFIAIAAPVRATPVAVDLELVLAVDVSRSVDAEEAALQRNGYIAAFRHPSVVDAIKHGPLGRIAVVYFEWGGYGNTNLVIDWTLIKDKATAGNFAHMLQKSARLVARRTGISGAMDVGAALLASNNFKGKRRVIDISGDGANNSGDLVDMARDRTVAKGITINGLPILNDRESPFGNRQVANLDLYYRDCVIGGPGAFHIVANSFKDFSRAILRKLILEIAGAVPQAAPTRDRARRGRWPQLPGNPYLIRAAGTRKAPPCYIGEQRWRLRRGYGPGGWMPQYPRQ